MRCSSVAAAAIALGAVASSAAADDTTAGVAIGAGGQGDAGYGALELRLDTEWRDVRVGLGGRAVWAGGALRTREWSRPADIVSLVRMFEAHAGPVAFAAGALAPATLLHVADGYRAALDDRARTGARVSLVTYGAPASEGMRAGTASIVEGSVEIDDVLDPALVGGALAWQLAAPWGIRAATAVDPNALGGSRVAIELGGARRWEREGRRFELGAGVVGESSATAMTSRDTGLGVVASASVLVDHAHARWSAALDVRAGDGTNGAAFGPLYRAERARISTAAPIIDDARAGAGGGLSLGVASATGWVAIGGRARPGLGPLGTVSAGAPMGRYLQAGAWVAASERATAGAAELRVAWATRFYSSLQLARMYTSADAPMAANEPDEISPAWSATVWFGVQSR